MKKKILLIIILLIIPFKVYSLNFPDTNSEIVEIYDTVDKKILYENKSNEKKSIASLTKIATTITAIESINNLDEEVTITQDILNTVSPDASVAGLKSGDKVTYKDLLYASILPSGADATATLAIKSSGNIENFVSKMNELKDRIGLKNTHFNNVNGLDDDNHYSTADDVRMLLEYSLKNNTFREIYTTKEYTMTNNKTVKSTLYKYSNSNINLDPIIGSKTGYTGNAGYCLSSISNINSHEIIIITLNAKKGTNSYNHIIDTLNLIDFLNNNFKEETLVEKNKIIKTLPVKLSKINNYKIKSSKEIKKYLPSDFDINNLKIEYSGLEKLSFNNKKNSKIGTIKYYYDNELISKEKVILNKDIKIDYIKVLKEYYIYIIGFTLIIIIIPIIIKKSKKKKHKRK